MTPTPAGPYVTDVPVRWSDQDAYGHVNHARVVTLLEEARAALLFDVAARGGVAAFEAGLLVAALDVRYRRPIPWSVGGVRVEMVVDQLRAASFLVRYRLLVAAVDGTVGTDSTDGTERGGRGGAGDGGGAVEWDTAKPAAEASTQLVPYDLATARPRRLSADERAFLAAYTSPGPS